MSRIIPTYENGEWGTTEFKTDSDFREYLEAKCVNVIGGCCGTTPEHIKLIAEEANNFSPRNIV